MKKVFIARRRAQEGRAGPSAQGRALRVLVPPTRLRARAPSKKVSGKLH